MPAIYRILGRFVFQPASAELDQNQASDLVVVNLKRLQIACRVRRACYRRNVRYCGEFTIRVDRPSGAITELEKIQNGFCDWYFYGFQSHLDEKEISLWHLLDLDAFRAHRQIHGSHPHIRCTRLENFDGTHFYAYEIASFDGDPKLVIASGDELSSVMPPDDKLRGIA